MASAEERDMREALADAMRRADPDARIVHELNVDHGQCRVDVAAIGRHTLIFAEVKSRKDKLDRLERQVQHFGRACHTLVVLLDEKFFGPRYEARLRPYRWSSSDVALWRWPKPAVDRWQDHAWRWPTTPQHFGVEPHARRLLELLWAEELRAEARRHHIACGARTSRWPLIRDMAYLLTGKEIAAAVCRQLRQRPMAEADPPV